MPISMLERLGNKFTVGDGCWEWTASRVTKGYGAFSVGGRLKPAHRVVYEMMVGPIPAGLQLDHLCRNRGCVRPDHLEPVTPRENCLRGESPAAKHAVQTHCINGHPFDEANTIRYRGSRYCRACQKINIAAYYARKRQTQVA